jgi:hypothetical protein
MQAQSKATSTSKTSSTSKRLVIRSKVRAGAGAIGGIIA